jgi:hypothetical protein
MPKKGLLEIPKEENWKCPKMVSTNHVEKVRAQRGTTWNAKFIQAQLI